MVRAIIIISISLNCLIITLYLNKYFSEQSKILIINPYEGPFENKSFKDKSFNNSDFSNYTISNSVFKNVNFKNIDLSYADIVRNAEFIQSDFITTKFYQAYILDVIFQQTDFFSTKFFQTHILDVIFKQIMFKNVNFNNNIIALIKSILPS